MQAVHEGLWQAGGASGERPSRALHHDYATKLGRSFRSPNIPRPLPGRMLKRGGCAPCALCACHVARRASFANSSLLRTPRAAVLAWHVHAAVGPGLMLTW
eukprot:352965-Chlamydomonas_euryale.AAC.38